MNAETTKIKGGPGAAAMIAAGIGSLFLGLMTTGAVLSADLKTALTLYAPAGPLSGKTTVAFAAWLISWAILGTIWKDKKYDLNRAFLITLILVGIGLVLTFPPVFEAFE